jgi:hypothetical protein
MRRILITLIILVQSMVLPGCVAYLDKPPLRTIAGEVIDEATSMPLGNITIYFYSGRRYMGMAETFGVDASAMTDAGGRFTVTARMNDMVTAIVYANSRYYRFNVPAFPADGVSKDIIWKINGQPTE